MTKPRASIAAARRHLVLVRHSQSAQDPRVPAHRWTLSDDGRRRCEALASRLAVFSPAIVASSPEPKALETARLVMARLGRSEHDIEIIDGLCEHARETLPWLAPDEFDATLREFFARPDVLVMGEESASQALLRFTRAATMLVRRPADGDVLIFTHATVLTLFVSACTGQDAFALWQTLGMPSFVVLTLPDLTIERMVGDVSA